MLDHARRLGLDADHIAGGVLQIDERRLRLAAELDELRRLGGPGRIERAVVGDKPYLVPGDRGQAAHGEPAVQRLEFEELGIIDDAPDHFAHVDGLAHAHRHQAGDLVRIQSRRALRRWLRADPFPLDACEQIARDANRIGIVFGDELRQARHARVHLGPAQVLVRGDLAGRRLEQRRPGQESLGAAAYHDHVIRQSRQVGAARGGGAVHHRDHRQSGRRQARQVVEQAAACDEALDLIGEQIGAAAFHQLDERQLVLQRDFLAAHDLAPAQSAQGAGADARIVGHHHAAHAGDDANAGEHCGAGNAAPGIGIVGAVAGQAREFQERHARIEQLRQPLARQQGAALVESRFRCRRCGDSAALQSPQLLDEREHSAALLLKDFGLGIDAGLGRVHLCAGRRLTALLCPALTLAARLRLCYPTVFTR